jgi:hypothetical protein
MSFDKVEELESRRSSYKVCGGYPEIEIPDGCGYLGNDWG